MLENIIKLHQEGRIDEAESACREHLADHPDDHRVLFLLGLLRIQAQRPQEAVEPLSGAASFAPDRVEYLVTLAGAQMQTGRQEAAEQALRAAIKLDPNSAPAYTGLARIAASQGNREEMQANIRLALRADPEWTDALMLAGTLAAESGDNDEAVRMFSRLAETRPKDASVQSMLGAALLAHGSSAFAEQAFRNALAVAPGHTRAVSGLAGALMEQGRGDEAVDVLRESAAGQPEVGLTLGQIHLARGEYAAAAEVLAPVHAEMPAMARASEGLAVAQIELGRFDEALATLQAWHDADPMARGAYTATVELEQRRGNPAGVVEALERWLAIEPADASALERLALTLETSHPDRAKDAAKDALAVNPELPGALLVMGRSKLREGDAAGARALLEPLIETLKLPSAAQALHRTLGAVFHALGEHASAVAHWLTMHRLDPRPAVLPRLAPPDRIEDVAPRADSAGQGDVRPVFVVAAPGIGLTQVAALLGDLGVPVLLDRFAGTSPRQDGLTRLSDEQLASDGLEETAAAFASAYRRGLEATDIDPAKPFVDLLPVLDVRWLPVIERALPGARVLLLVRDLRDCYINWLACGGSPQPALIEPKAATVWLLVAMSHLRHASGFPFALSVDLDAVLENDAVPVDVAALFDLESAPQPRLLRASLVAQAGLPVWLDAGSWKAFSQVLTGPVAVLDEDGATGEVARTTE